MKSTEIRTRLSDSSIRFAVHFVDHPSISLQCYKVWKITLNCCKILKCLSRKKNIRFMNKIPICSLRVREWQIKSSLNANVIFFLMMQFVLSWSEWLVIEMKAFFNVLTWRTSFMEPFGCLSLSGVIENIIFISIVSNRLTKTVFSLWRHSICPKFIDGFFIFKLCMGQVCSICRRFIYF